MIKIVFLYFSNANNNFLSIKKFRHFNQHFEWQYIKIILLSTFSTCVSTIYPIHDLKIVGNAIRNVRSEN